MIQLNLLPDSVLYEIRTKKIYDLITRVTFLISILMVVIMIGLFIEVKIIQGNNISKNSGQITNNIATLNKVSGLNSILKINDTIKALPLLYNSRPDVTRLSGYLSLITPANVSIKTLSLNFTTNTINLSGSANNIGSINTFVDTLKFCEYTTSNLTSNQLAFSKVVLSSYSYSPASTTNQNFSVSAFFVPQIFATNVSGVQLIVPNKITTRSAVDQPTALFNTQSNG